METNPVLKHPSFLAGGGACGALIRNMDWSQTPLGEPTHWPVALRHAVRFMLHATLPVYIAWGPKLIRLYNDSYIPTLGPARHPATLGTSIMDEPEIWSVARPLFEKVLQGESVSRKDFKVRISKGGEPEDCYFDMSYTPLYNDDDTIGGIQAVFIETTDKVRAINQTVQGIQRFRSLVQQAPVAMSLLRGQDFIVELVNDAYLPLLGMERSLVAGRPVFELLPQARPVLEPVLRNVLQTGEPFELKEFEIKLTRNSREETCFFNALYEPLLEEDGTVSGIMTVAHEITEQIQARKTLEQSEAHLKNLIDAVPAKIWMSDPTGYCTYLNPRWYQFTGQTPGEALGHGWLNAVHPDDAEEAGKVFFEANEKRLPFSLQYRLRNKEGQYLWAIDAAKPRFAADGTYDGMVGTVVNIHEQKVAEDKIRESEELFRSFSDNLQNLAWMANGDGWIWWYNQRWYDYTGTNLEEMQGWGWEKVHHPDHIDRVVSFVKEAWTKPQAWELTFPLRGQDGVYRWFLTRAEPVINSQGEITRWIGTNTNVDEQVKAQEKLVEAENRARLYIEAAELGTLEHDFATGVTNVSEKALQITGLPVFSTAEAFAAVIHPDDLHIRQAALQEVMTTGVLFYEVRIFWPDKSVHWIKVRGDVLYDPTGKPFKIVGVVQDITDAKTKEETLEAKVAARTQELADANSKLAQLNGELLNSNEELSQYAYIASHDLQEPLRKIRIFSGILSANQTLPPDVKTTIERIDRSAGRMSGLIKDLLDFSQLSKTESLVRPLPLNGVVQAVAYDYELLIQEKGARIEVQTLPVVEGVALQMNQLFYNLIGNALKFSAAGQTPLIQVYSTVISEGEAHQRVAEVMPGIVYHRITVEDNGIGFDARYVEKIFEIFKRLHTKDLYAGSGIGLALCRRIALNHKGAIWAEAKEGQGARFHIILPEKQMVFQPDVPGGLAWK